MSDVMLTVAEVAEKLRLSTRTIHAMLRAGDLPGFRVRAQWRVWAAELDAWIAAQAGVTA